MIWVNIIHYGKEERGKAAESSSYLAEAVEVLSWSVAEYQPVIDWVAYARNGTKEWWSNGEMQCNQ